MRDDFGSYVYVLMNLSGLMIIVDVVVIVIRVKHDMSIQSHE